MKTWMMGAAGLALAAGLAAAPLQDWSAVKAGENMGTYDDGKGSKVTVEPAEGPSKGAKAVRLACDLKEWGGFWALAQVKGLGNAKAIGFKARAERAGRYTLSLTDAKKNQVIASFRVAGGDWQDFVLPLSLFAKTPWPMADAPKDGVFDPATAASFAVSPEIKGKSALVLGPLELLDKDPGAATGIRDGGGKDGVLAVQDFETLESGFGTFADDKNGCKVAFETAADPRAKGNTVGKVKYTMTSKGWGGVWLRAGDGWGGQDWRGGKAFTLRVNAAKPVDLELAFNDANQCAYVAPAVHAEGKAGWQELSVPLDGFQLNAWYQPPEAKKGAPLDLSKVETFNIGVKGEGAGDFLVDEVLLHKR